MQKNNSEIGILQKKRTKKKKQKKIKVKRNNKQKINFK